MQSFKNYYGRSANPPFKTPQEVDRRAWTSPKSSNVRRTVSKGSPTQRNTTKV